MGCREGIFHDYRITGSQDPQDHRSKQVLDSQNSQAQYHRDRRLRLGCHFRVPQHRNGQQRVKPVAHDAQHRERIRGLDDLPRAHACVAWDRVVPLRRDRSALENVPQEQHRRHAGNDAHAGPDDPLVAPLGGQAEQEHADAEFDEHHVGNVRSGRQGLPLVKRIWMSVSLECKPGRGLSFFFFLFFSPLFFCPSFLPPFFLSFFLITFYSLPVNEHIPLWPISPPPAAGRHCGGQDQPRAQPQ